ncbi:hypothetical protein [Olleya sp. YS]|uniref:hypothetical protein n=1 Tax=Olleya sp. YS TaxID=3028318 RepID=UPI002434459E|nr:hypothetical protein [Olleya sp. YS]WGD33617.1 hypothetical protein Ollyesu_07475 [Olleya sp. YS]
MKNFIVIILSLFAILSYSQSKLKYNRAHVIFPGCQDAEDVSDCYDTKVLQFIDTSLTDEVNSKLIQYSKKDTLKIYTRIYFDETGTVLQKLSNISASVDSLKNELNYLIAKFPKVAPVLDETNKGVAEYKSSVFGFTIDRALNTLSPIENYQPEEVPFSIIEKVPIYLGCEKDLLGDEARKCMNDKLRIHIGKHFRSELANSLDLDAGIHRIFVFFKINKEGEITSIKARAPHPALEREAIRIMSLVPKLSAPGIQRGKPVIVPFYIPISFMIEDAHKLSKKEVRRLKRKKRN